MIDERTLFLTLAAISVGLIGFGLVQVMLGLFPGSKARLHERLFAGQWQEDMPQAGSGVQKPSEELTGPLAQFAGMQRLNRRLRQVAPGTTMGRFFGMVVVLATLPVVLFTLLLERPIAGLVAGFLAGMVPFVVVRMRWNRRLRVLNDQLVDALDFLSRVLRAGHSLATGLQMVGQEMPDPIAGEFRHAYDQHSLGRSIDEVMTELAERVESSDYAFFVTSVLIQRQTGGDLSEILDNLCGMVRARIRLQQHTRAITAEGRLTAYLLTGLPLVLLLILFFLNPSYEGVLLKTEKGRMLLTGMVIFQLIGLWVMKRIVTVKV